MSLVADVLRDLERGDRPVAAAAGVGSHGYVRERGESGRNGLPAPRRRPTSPVGAALAVVVTGLALGSVALPQFARAPDRSASSAATYPGLEPSVSGARFASAGGAGTNGAAAGLPPSGPSSSPADEPPAKPAARTATTPRWIAPRGDAARVEPATTPQRKRSANVLLPRYIRPLPKREAPPDRDRTAIDDDSTEARAIRPTLETVDARVAVRGEGSAVSRSAGSAAVEARRQRPRWLDRPISKDPAATLPAPLSGSGAAVSEAAGSDAGATTRPHGTDSRLPSEHAGGGLDEGSAEDSAIGNSADVPVGVRETGDASSIEVVQRPLSAGQRRQNDLRRALDAYREGDHVATEELLSETLARDPEFHEGRLLLARSHARRGRFADAERSLSEGLLRFPQHAPYVVLHATLLAQQGRDGAAIDALVNAAPSMPGDARLHALLAGLHQRVGDSLAAADSYRVALRIDPSAGEWWMGLGMSSEQAGDDDTARSAYAEALRHSMAGEVERYVARRLRNLGSAAPAVAGAGDREDGP